MTFKLAKIRCAQLVTSHLFSSPPSSQALSLIESEDLVQEERARKAAVRKSKMDANLDAESAHLQEKKGVNHLLSGMACITEIFIPLFMVLSQHKMICIMWTLYLLYGTNFVGTYLILDGTAPLDIQPYGTLSYDVGYPLPHVSVCMLTLYLIFGVVSLSCSAWFS